MAIEIQMHGVKWAVGDAADLIDGEGNPTTGKVLLLNDGDSNITVVVKLSSASADSLAQSLTASGILPTKGMSPEEMKKEAERLRAEG